MSEHTYERDVLMSYGRLAAAVAAITSAVFMSIKGATNWSIAVGIYCVLAFLTMFPLQFTAKERLQYQHTVDITFGNLFRFLFRNKYLLLYYLGYLAIGCTNTLQTMAVYFANSNLGNESMVTVIMGTTILPIIVMAPFLPKLIQRFGKKPLTMFSCIAVILLCVLQYVVGYDNLPIFLAIAALRVIFMQLPLMIYGMFTADCIEYGAYKTGQRTEGIAFSVQTLVTKLSGAICSTLCLQTLYYFGYVEQAATQSAHTLQGIWILMSLVPMFGYAIMFVVMCFYKLDETMVEEMMKANRSKGGILS
jgi:probable glucitol transport protein GutA